MEPIVAGGLVLGLTVTALVFVGLCNAAANKIYDAFFARGEPEVPAAGMLPEAEPQRRSA